jgi:F0F1-type ATP synthase membrane subunit b/b'
MGQIFTQLGVDQTLFIQLAIYVVVFAVLRQIYFKPFLRLIETRHKKTVQDKESAERILAQAEQKLAEYTRRLSDARAEAKANYDALIEQAKKEESEILAHSRNEAKTITQEAIKDVEKQAAQLRKELEIEVDAMARVVTEKLLLRKV